MFCQKCGTKLNNEDLFCYKCGHNVNSYPVCQHTEPNKISLPTNQPTTNINSQVNKKCILSLIFTIIGTILSILISILAYLHPIKYYYEILFLLLIGFVLLVFGNVYGIIGVIKVRKQKKYRIIAIISLALSEIPLQLMAITSFYTIMAILAYSAVA